MKHLILGLALALTSCAPAHAIEIDFGAKMLDLDGKPYRDCAKPPVAGECPEWVEHTLGLLAYTALDQPERAPNPGVLETILLQARRGALARRIYPGKDEVHVVDVTTKEIDTIIEYLGKLTVRPVEILRAIELLDPTRLK